MPGEYLGEFKKLTTLCFKLSWYEASYFLHPFAVLHERNGSDQQQTISGFFQDETVFPNAKVDQDLSPT
jgi:hypothetical protein